jgi:hypothetical protein
MRRSTRDTKANPEPAARDHMRREPLPTARAILWKPLPDSYHLLASMMRTPAQQAQLFVTQRSFLQVERHLRSAPELDLGGFLAGQLCQCPRTHVRYAVVNTVVPFAEVSGDPIGSRVTRESFDAVRKRLDAHGLSVIGWYRNGAGLGLQLLPDDIETHLTYFDQPWQTTMLVVPDSKKPKGAFFTYDPRVGRSYCIPFYELFDPHAAETNRTARTCVTWTTYVPASPVEPLAAADTEIVEATVTPMPSAPADPEPPEPLDELWDAIKDPWVKLKDVAVRPSRHDDLPLLWEPPGGRTSEPLPKRLETKAQPVPVQERRAPDESIPSPVAPAANGAQTPVRAAPPFSGPVRPATQTPTSVPPLAARLKAPQGPPIAPAPAAPRSQDQARRSAPPPFRPIPPATAEAMRRAAEGPAIVVPSDFEDKAVQWQRRRRIGFAVAAASFLAVIALSTIRARASGSAQAASAAPTAVPTPPEQASTRRIASLDGNVILALPAAVDSLSRSLSYYRELETSHRRGLAGCAMLQQAYRRVSHARTRVDSARGRISGALDVPDSIRLSMLGAEYTYVAQTYRRSGCTN